MVKRKRISDFFIRQYRIRYKKCKAKAIYSIVMNLNNVAAMSAVAMEVQNHVNTIKYMIIIRRIVGILFNVSIFSDLEFLQA